MRLLIVLPEQNRATGNWATARRFRRGLERSGHDVGLCPTPLDPREIRNRVRDFAPDLALLLHAFRSGSPWLESGERVPFLVLLTGTDLNSGLRDRRQGAVIRQVMEGSEAILIQNPLLAEAFRTRQPGLAGRLHVLPPGVELGTAPFGLRRELGIAAELPLFLCPAGVRPVKNQVDLIERFDGLKGCDFRLAFCGPVLDPEYGRRFHEALRNRPWTSWIGTVPPEAMASALREADVVVNHSLSEGLPNALVEAAALGRPILARDIPGNAAVITHGRNGLLYSDAAGFARCATRLIADPALRDRLSHPDPDRYTPERETRKLEAICRSVLVRP